MHKEINEEINKLCSKEINKLITELVNKYVYGKGVECILYNES